MVSSGLLRRVVLTKATRRNNPEDPILHRHRRKNLKSYILLITSRQALDSTLNPPTCGLAVAQVMLDL
jgi:hypothetical protein